MKGRNLTTFPSLPSDRETSGWGPARQSGHFNYKKQRKGKGGVVGVGVGAAGMVVAVYLFVWGSFVCAVGVVEKSSGGVESYLYEHGTCCLF